LSADPPSPSAGAGAQPATPSREFWLRHIGFLAFTGYFATDILMGNSDRLLLMLVRSLLGLLGALFWLKSVWWQTHHLGLRWRWLTRGAVALVGLGFVVSAAVWLSRLLALTRSIEAH